jgi:hypothetical protein
VGAGCLRAGPCGRGRRIGQRRELRRRSAGGARQRRG